MTSIMQTMIGMLKWAGLLGYAVACVFGVLLARFPRSWNYVVHTLTAISSLLVAVSALYDLVAGHKEIIVVQAPYPLSLLPPLYMVIDPLSAFMALVVSLVALYASIFAIGYVDEYYEHPGKLAILGLCFPSFIASMILVAFAGDVISFVVLWEVMTVTSFLLVLLESERLEVRQAGVVYMVFATFSAVCLLASFALGYMFTGDYVFAAWKTAKLTPFQASLIFVLALLGFSAKAGVVPFHSWLPRAHPAAPSHVSALLSGVMVKLAMYGIVRIALDVLAPWASSTWGTVVLLLGALSTFYGVALAIIQHDIKRLLAYHTIENIGIILLGIGLAISAYAAGNYALAVLGIIAGLFHLINHALFKSLLFLCSGALLHQVHTRDIDEMGGLYRKLKATAFAFLIASLGITAIPLFNGFASEWCAYNSLMLGMSSLPDLVARFASLLSILSLSAAGVLAVYCFTKVFGVVFLGAPRSEEARHAEEEPLSMKVSYVLPAALIVLLGIVPGVMVNLLSTVGVSLVGKPLVSVETPILGLLVNLWETPSAYIPLIIAASIAIVAIIAWAYALSKTRYTTVTEPFVSGAEYDEKAMNPTPLLYVGTLEDIMSSMYGVRKEYARAFAVEYWVLKSVKVLEKPYALLARLIRRAGLPVVDLEELPERFDDVFYAFFWYIGNTFSKLANIVSKIDSIIYAFFWLIGRVFGKLVTVATKIDRIIYACLWPIGTLFTRLVAIVSRVDNAIYSCLRPIGILFTRLTKIVIRIQCGSLHVYLLYIYIAFFMLLLYYVVVG
ncbi:MAG TPA: hypothetical protein EYH59_05060 [Pyrodictium sp.]|nr:hypothetical protein [Pyrodictium sp.]